MDLWAWNAQQRMLTRQRVARSRPPASLVAGRREPRCCGATTRRRCARTYPFRLGAEGRGSANPKGRGPSGSDIMENAARLPRRAQRDARKVGPAIRQGFARPATGRGTASWARVVEEKTEGRARGVVAGRAARRRWKSRFTWWARNRPLQKPDEPQFDPQCITGSPPPVRRDRRAYVGVTAKTARSSTHGKPQGRQADTSASKACPWIQQSPFAREKGGLVPSFDREYGADAARVSGSTAC